MCTYMLCRRDYIRKNIGKIWKELRDTYWQAEITGGCRAEKNYFCLMIIRRIFHSIMEYAEITKVYLSVAKEEKEYKKLGLPLVADRYVDAGPLGGILSGLLSCEEEGLFVVPWRHTCHRGGVYGRYA